MFPNYIAYNFLFAELLGRYVYIFDLPYFLFPLLTITVIYLIAKIVFNAKVALISTIIFIISPWFWYLFDTHSLYVLNLSLILVTGLGVLYIIRRRNLLGNIYLFIPAFMLIYSSSLFFVLVPVFIAILIFSKTIKLNSVKYGLIILILFCLPLASIIYKNKGQFKNKLAGEVMIFSDPGLINSINRYQGAAAQEGFKNLARVAENKYIFYAEYTSLKYMDQLVPVTYLTSEYKLLGFSLSPPILLGFLIPLVYGLYKLLSDSMTRKYILLSTLLVIPSMLGNEMVSLNRLILFSPVIIILAAYGITQLTKRKSTKFFLYLTIFLVVFQLILTIYDIKTHELIRSKTYFGKHYVQLEP